VIRSAGHPAAPVTTLLKSLERCIEAEIDASNIHFQFAPNVRFLSSRYAIGTIWKMHQEEALMSRQPLGSENAHLQIGGDDLLSILNLSPAAWAFRSQLACGAPLGAAFSSATAICADFDCALEIATLLNDGCIVEVAAATDIPGE
jgi:hypothetical protein